MKLYNFHASSTSYRTRIVLNLKGLDYEYIPIRLDKGEHLSEAYGKINPMRGVPTLGDRLACASTSRAPSSNIWKRSTPTRRCCPRMPRHAPMSGRSPPSSAATCIR